MSYGADGVPGEPVTPSAGAELMRGSLLAPPRKFGGVLACAAGTFKKAKEGTPFSRALIREEEKAEASLPDPGVRYAPALGVQAFRRFRVVLWAFACAWLAFVTS